jgi:3-methyladenine DNA glycosylase AlkC
MAIASIPEERVYLLNQGLEPSQNLQETLAIDFNTLLSHVFPRIPQAQIHQSEGVTKRMSKMANHILQHKGAEAFYQLQSHSSDIARGWACYVLSQLNYPLEDTLDFIAPLADDGHSGVREWAWLALRPLLANDVVQSIDLLASWTQSPSERIRRFVTEGTRPRGVWCPHIPLLKQEPWLGLKLLTPLRSDPSIYVQKSVGNWLNDAGKHRPEWVQELCQEWLTISPTRETQKICKRATRNFIRMQS